MKCVKCKSENVTVQMITDTHSKKQGHGILYWLCFGWFIDFLLWIFLTIPRILIALFMPKKQKIVSKTSSMAVCQSCGHSWKIN